MAARINGEQVPLRTELKNGDVVEVVTAPVSTPNPAWLSFVRTGRARSKIRHHLKTLAQAESAGAGRETAAAGAARRGHRALPDRRRRHPRRHLGQAAALHRQPQPRRAADRHRPGQAHRQHRGQALVDLLAERGEKPDALLITRERFTAARDRGAGRRHRGRQRERLGPVRQLLPTGARATRIVGYLGRGEGLVVHVEDCAVRASCATRTASASSASTGRTSRSAPSKPASWSQ